MHSYYGSKWRQNEDQLIIQSGEKVDTPLQRTVEHKRYLSKKDEEELAAWYQATPGPLTQPVVVKKLRETHPTIFQPTQQVDAVRMRKRAGNWLYSFLKRYKLEGKGRFAPL